MVALTGLCLVGCGRERSSALDGTITVSAAASLTEAFSRIGEDFTATHPGSEITFTFDSSSRIAAQILEGAPTDVYASADTERMTELADAGLVTGDREVFAANELVVVTKPGNPEGIEELADLEDVGVIALCAEDAPCGRFAEQILEDAGVSIPEQQVTRGQNVKATLAAVNEGDAVAGIVYNTDAVAADDAVATVTIPAEHNAVATYPIGVLSTASNPALARAFVDYVLGKRGQAVLEELGFRPET